MIFRPSIKGSLKRHILHPGRGHNHSHGERAGEEGLRGVQGQGQELAGRGRGGGQGQRHRAAGQAQGAARGLRRQEHQGPYSALLRCQSTVKALC